MGLGLYFLFTCLPVYANGFLILLPATHSPLSNICDNVFISVYLKRDLGCVFVHLIPYRHNSALYTRPFSVTNLRFIVGADFRPKYK